MLFVLALFFLKTKSEFKNEKNQSGLVYNGTETVEDIVNRDTDKDGLLDWQESLFGTDPTKKDTDGNGVPDNAEVEKITAEARQNGGFDLNLNEENLTETDKLARELFSTVASLNQAGAVDQSTVEQLSSSLIEKIKNSTPRKTFLISDIKIVKNDTAQAVKIYNDTLDKISKDYPYPKKTIPDVLEKLVIDGENIDESVLPELDPIVKQLNKILSEILKVPVPESLASLHLEFINELQKLSENVSDIRLYDTDIIIALSGINKYETTATNLDSAAINLSDAIKQRLR